MIGLWDKTLNNSNLMDYAEEGCGQKPCPYLCKVPHCQFMNLYRNYLHTLNIDEKLKQYEAAAKEVQEMLGFKEEPEIVLLVFEPKACVCAERPILQEFFHATEL